MGNQYYSSYSIYYSAIHIYLPDIRAVESPPSRPEFPPVANGSPAPRLPPDMNIRPLPDNGYGVLLSSGCPPRSCSSAGRLREVCGWLPLLESSCLYCCRSISFCILNSLNYKYSSSDMCLIAASSLSSRLSVWLTPCCAPAADPLLTDPSRLPMSLRCLGMKAMSWLTAFFSSTQSRSQMS